MPAMPSISLRLMVFPMKFAAIVNASAFALLTPAYTSLMLDHCAASWVAIAPARARSWKLFFRFLHLVEQVLMNAQKSAAISLAQRSVRLSGQMQ